MSVDLNNAKSDSAEETMNAHHVRALVRLLVYKGFISRSELLAVLADERISNVEAEELLQPGDDRAGLS